MFDRSAIFQAAWATAKRRKAVYSGSLREHFRAGLQMAWWDVKEAARRARQADREAAGRAAHFAGRSVASIRAEVEDLENTDRLGFDGIERLSTARRALAEAEAREVEAVRKAITTRAQRHPNLLPVWDAEANARQLVSLATVLSIKVDITTHTFASVG